MIWGVDIGVRSFYAVGLPELDAESVQMHAFERKQGKTRYFELRDMVEKFSEIVITGDRIFVEEPPLAGRMNIRVGFQLNQAVGAILSATSAQGYLVPVTSWKMVVCGNGAVDKSVVAGWLRLHHPGLADQCESNQNLVDATCIALYGQHVIAATSGISGVSTGDLDLSL